MVRAALAVRASPTDGLPETDSRVERRLRLQFVTFATEPARIRNYLHAKVDEVEGALSATLPDPAEERLFERAEKELFRSIEDMRRVRDAPSRCC